MVSKSLFSGPINPHKYFVSCNFMILVARISSFQGLNISRVTYFKDGIIPRSLVPESLVLEVRISFSSLIFPRSWVSMVFYTLKERGIENIRVWE